jgi:predicted Ser/Thr protein kinase
VTLQPRPRDWANRLATSLRRHETERREARPALARYQELEEIGRGGMGIVYRARDTLLGRDVALKVLADEAGLTPDARERFLREAEVAARLSHPNIIPVFDTGEFEGRVFFAMKLVDGERLDRARLDLRSALGALRDAARAIQHAHEQGVIHRDLKPSNLMVDRQGIVYVMDFGLARRSDPAARLTLTGRILGTPAYMPPEQTRGLPTDARSDVYSLGATMYEVLSGHAPFTGPNELEVLKSAQLEEPVPPRRRNPAIPKDVEAVILKAMDKSPDRRYASAADLAEDIRRYLDGEPVTAPTRGTLYRLRKKVARHRWRVIAGTSLAALAAIAVLLRLMLDKRDVEIAGALSDREQLLRIDSVESAFREALRTRALPEASAKFETLLKLAPKRAEPLLPDLLDLEFDLGIERLAERAKEGKVDRFKDEYKRLQAERFQGRRDKLSRIVLDLGLKLAGNEAVTWLDEAFRLGMRDGDLFEKRALALVGEKQWARAHEDFKEYKERKRPKPSEICHEFARLFAQLGTDAFGREAWQEAIEQFTAALDLEPDDPRLLHDRGLARRRAGRPLEEALADLEKALQKAGFQPHEEWSEVAVAHSRKLAEAWKDPVPENRRRAWNDATKWLDLLIERGPGDLSDLRLERARMKRRLGDPKSALEDADAAKDSAEAFLLRGQLHHLLDEHQAASYDLDRAVQARASPLALFWRASARHLPAGLENSEAVLDACLSDRRAALAAGLESPHARSQAATILAERGLRAPAAESRPLFDEAVDLASAALRKPIVLSEDEYVAERGERAGRSYPEAVSRFERNGLVIRATAHTGRKDYAAAIKDCTEAIKLDEAFARAYLWRAVAHRRSGALDPAKKDYARVLEISTDASERDAAEKGLKSLGSPP